MKVSNTWVGKRALGPVLLLSFLASCASSPASDPVGSENLYPQWSDSSKGTLFIAGGAVDARGPLLPRFFEEADKAAKRLERDHTRVEIIPTASGDPAGSLQYNWENFSRVAPHVTIGGLPLSELDLEAAFDPKITGRFEDASAIWFTGGDQSRITALFQPGYRSPSASPAPSGMEPRPIDLSLLGGLYDGGLIGGSSAGAAIMSEHMITGGRSEKALLHGHGNGGVSTSKGLGYFPFGIVDQHFLARGRLGRLLVATAAHGLRFGFGVEENSAMIVTLGEKPMIEVLGNAGLCVLDIGPDHHSLMTVDGVPTYPGTFPDPWEFEISLLGTGDRWDPLTGKAIPHATRIPLVLPVTSPVPEARPLEPWDSGAIETAIHRLSMDPNIHQVLKSDFHRVEILIGPDTQFLINPSHSSDLFATKVRVTITKL